jgi:hypothetical protein
MNERIKQLSDRITAYLFNGGLFNPELANHLAVRDLLMECREAFDERTKIVAKNRIFMIRANQSRRNR